MNLASIIIAVALFISPAFAAVNNNGSFATTFGQCDGILTDVKFGTPVGSQDWITSQDITSIDFDFSCNTAPGSGAVMTITLEHAPLDDSTGCNDISSWTSVALGTVTGPSEKGFAVRNVAVDIPAPSCFHARMIWSGTRTQLGGGLAGFHTNGAFTHYQGQANGAASSEHVCYIGNVVQCSNVSNRAYFIAPAPVRLVGGVFSVRAAPGAGLSRTVQIGYSSPTSGQDCFTATQTVTAVVASISGATQKTVRWDPVDLGIPATARCFQMIETCSVAATCADAVDLDGALDIVMGPIEFFGTAGSGAFDADHSFGVGPWAISDANRAAKTFDQQYWRAPVTGLSACAGGITLQTAVGGSGQYDVGLITSTTAPSTTQAITDLSFSSSATLCSIAAGSKSCFFSMTAFKVPASAGFALNVATSGGTPTSSGVPFNWGVVCSTAANSTLGAGVSIGGNVTIR